MAEPHAPAPIVVRIKTHRIGGEDRDRAFVVPPSFRVGKGATKVPSVRWENGTKEDVKFWFPNGAKLFHLPPKAGNDDIRGISHQDGFDHPLVIPPGKVLTLYVNDDSTDGEYHYHLYCNETGDCAHGKSEPWGGRP